MKPISWKRISISVSGIVAIAFLSLWAWKDYTAPPPLPPMQTKAPIEIKITIRGRVLDPQGSPVAFARIYLLELYGVKGWQHWVDELITGENGEYAFEQIAGYDATHPMHQGASAPGAHLYDHS